MMDEISECLNAESDIQFPIDETLLHPLTTSSEPNIREETRSIKKSAKEQIQGDYEFARSNLIRILEEGMQLVPTAVMVAKESESPRQFEAIATLLKTVADINKDLVELSERRIKSDSENDSQKTFIAQQTNQTAVFCGSTEDLMSKLFPRKSEEPALKTDFGTIDSINQG